jgi:putative MFS transporter
MVKGFLEAPKKDTLQRRAVWLVGLGLAVDVYDVFIMGFVIAGLPESTSPNTKALLLGAGFLGMALGASLLGVLSDRIGRKRLFRLNLLCFSMFSGACALTGTLAGFALMRFFAGVFLGAELPLADAYLSEVLPAKARGRLCGYAYSLSFLAVPLAGVVSAFLLPIHAPVAGWRYAMLLGASCGIFVWFGLRALPESPKWLLMKEKWAKTSYSDQNSLKGHSPRQMGRPGHFKELFSATYLRRTWMLWLFHVFQGSAYYAFSSLTPLVLRMKGFELSEGSLFGGMMFLGYPLGSLLSVPLLDRLERKWVIVLSTLALAFLAVLMTLLVSTPSMLVLGFGFTLLSNVFSNAYHVYQAELYPTRLRGMGVGVAYSLSRLSTGLMPFLFVPLLERLGPGWLYGVIALFELILALDIGIMGPRTSGRPLEVISPE